MNLYSFGKATKESILELKELFRIFDSEDYKVQHTNKYDSMPKNIDSYEFTKGAGTHAEVIALNKALKANPNACIDDFVINVIRTGQNKNKPAVMMLLRCPHFYI
ncbi:hypothetical protein [Paucisalibacillus globulus]|uniref:hypothetical protein n=1 Tax=Paucisalibacillus globulus TaxID=351095 RepID=UPI00040FDF07|nr:hypothetical protein [Paucisalibacillus globulus]